MRSQAEIKLDKKGYSDFSIFSTFGLQTNEAKTKQLIIILIILVSNSSAYIPNNCLSVNLRIISVTDDTPVSKNRQNITRILKDYNNIVQNM